MTDIRSLHEETHSGLTRQLLESARSDGSAPGARERALIGLGLVPSGLLAAVPEAAASTLGKGTAWLVAKSLGVGLMASVVVLGSLSALIGRSERPAPSASAHSVLSTAAPRVEPQDALPALPPSASVVAPALSAPSPSSLARPPASAPTSDLSAQLAALAEIRRTLAGQEPSRALELLGDFDGRFPASPVAEEKTVLRVEALDRAGKKLEAQALGRAFLRQRPTSVYAARVRSLLDFP